jgi:cobalt-zinc-cadmium efflux system outer membrane protein
MRTYSIFIFTFIFLYANLQQVNAQQQVDTISISLPEAEILFQKNNLQLLAQQYSIDSAKSNIITAKLYDNPQFGIASGFYQPVSKRIFDFSNDNREIAMQFSQLVKTAGKRNRSIQIAKTGVQITEYQFYDLLRTLRYVLRNDFYNMYYLQQMQKVYRTEIESLQTTAAAFGEQVPKGNIARKELVRIKSQLYNLQTELLTLQGSIDDIHSEFKLLIRAKANAYIIPTAQINESPKAIVQQFSYQSLLDSAYQNRFDLKIAKAAVVQNQQNITLQKALAVPDITVSAGYDRLGSYVKNFNNIGVGLSIPIFNRNQGNIKQAIAMMESSKLQATAIQDGIESQVANVYTGAIKAENLLLSFDPAFENDFTTLIHEVTKNYELRNINLLEFIDFYDSYKQNVLQLNSLRYNRISQLEQLNYTTGTLIFNK